MRARAAARKGDSARAAIAGPRSEPPMPMLTTSVKRAPVDAANGAGAHGLGKRQHLLALGLDHGPHVLRRR